MLKKFVSLAAIVFAFEACSPMVAKTVARSAIDVALAICISEHADISDEKALRSICQWTDELAPTVHELLSARAQGLAKASKAGACGPGAK